MSRRLGLCLIILATLVAAPAARAAGPPIGSLQDGIGVVAPNGGDRYIALGSGDHTLIAAVRITNGSVRASTVVPGSWGIPAAVQGSRAGISPDGRTLVVTTTKSGNPSRFIVVDTATMQPKSWIVLKGTFAFDALSPDGTRLFLIQHMSLDDYSHYVVRGYDLRTNRLEPGRIADKTQTNWVMQGFALTRATSAGGRSVYTLYMNPGGYPFIHALDTVRGVAHCIGLPWTQDQGKLGSIVLTLGDHGRSLVARWRNGRTWLTIDTSSWRITHPRAGGFAWRWPATGAGAGMLVALALAAVALSRRRRAGERRDVVPLPL